MTKVDMDLSLKTIGYLQELGSAVVATALHGASAPHSLSGKTNKQALEDGVGDVLTGITLLVERHDLDRDAINKRVNEQVERLRGPLEPPAPPEPVKKRSWWGRQSDKISGRG